MKEYYKKTTRRIPSAILPPSTERFSGVRIASGLILILLAVAVFAGSGAAADATNTSITNWAQLNDNITNWNSVGDTDLLTIIIPADFNSDDAEGKVNIDVSRRVLIKPADVDSNEIKLDAKQQGRLFTINSGGNLTLTGNGSTVLNLTGGQVTGDNGGGIYIYSGNLTLQANANITGCKALGVSQNGGIGGGVYVGEDGTFTMSSGNITGCTSSTYIYFFSGGGGVYNRGTFTMSGGSITGCTSILNSFGGGGVYNWGTFTMSGGSITGCTANSFGGGVYVGEDGTFTMSGGSITNCTAYSGGGVYVNNNNGTFTMSGGSITDCKATSYRSRGGGVINLGTFTMSGGSITGCTADTGGGVYVGVDGTFTMSGGSINDCSASRGSGVSINYYFRETGGKYIDCFGTFVMNGTAVVANEVYLMANTTDYHFCTQITLGTNGFSSPDAGAKKITLEGNVANLLGKTIVKGGAKNASCFALNSSITGYGLLAKSGEDLVLEAAAKIDETGIAYSTVEYAFSNVTAGQTVKLLKDSTLTTEIIIDGMNKSATLNLNGFTLTAAENQRLFTISSEQSFNLTDSKGTGALKGNDTVTDNGGGVCNYGTFNMTSGNITGCNAYLGGGVYNYGTFNMKGGSITYCNATDPECGDGGGVYNDGTFNMSGGRITGCTANGYGGGGVANSGTGTFTMSGSSSITNCNAMNGGGGVLNSGTLTMSGSGSITNCNAMNGGGGVANSGTFNISGSPKITGNTNSTSIKENVGLIQGWSKFNLVGNYNGDGIGISVYDIVVGDPIEPVVGVAFANATGQYTGADKIFSDRNPNFVGLLSPVAANGQDYQIVWKDTTPTPVPPTPKPTVVPTSRPSSGGSSTNTGAGHYTQYPRQVSNTDTISFGSSQIVSSVDLNNPTTGTVTVYYDTDSTYKNNQNYAADASAQTSAEGGEGVTVKTAGIKGAPVLVSSPEKEGSISFYETFRIESDLKDGKVTEINFKVAKSGLLTNGVTKTDVILYHGLVDAKNNGEWIPLNTYLTGEDKTYAYYKAYTDGTSPFAIVFMEDMTIVDETVQEPVPVDISEPAVHQTVTAVPTTVPTQAQTPVQTQASKSPLMLGGIIAGLAAAGVLLGRRE